MSGFGTPAVIKSINLTYRNQPEKEIATAVIKIPLLITIDARLL